MKNLFFWEKGQSLIELMVTIGLAAVLLPALLTGFVATRSGRAQAEQRQQAIALVREGQEAVRVFREADWTDFANFSGQTVYPKIINPPGTWALTATPQILNGFTRTITIADVYRDSTSFAVIATCVTNCYNDPSTKQVTTTVSWTTPIAKSVSATEYLTRNGNTTFVDTATTDFNQGTIPPTISIDASIGDGAVKLGPGVGGGDWCSPQPIMFKTKNIEGNGVPIAVTASTQTGQDTVYASTGDNASGWVMTQLIVPHTTNPDDIQNPYFNNENGVKAYGLFSDNNYVYFNEKASHNHTVQIAEASDLSNVGYFDPTSGSVKGISVYVATIGTKDTGFTTAGNKLYAFDLSTPQGNPPSSRLGSRSQLDDIDLAGLEEGQRVVVVGTNAYVASSGTTNQLQIFNVSDPTNMSLAKSITLGSGKGVDVFVDPEEKYAYVITDLANNNFFIVDLNNTNLIYAYSTLNGMVHPKGIIVPLGSKRAVIVGFGGQTYQVFKVDDPTAATWCGGISPAGIYAVSGVTQPDTGKVFSYIVTDDSSKELQVIQGGPGGSGSQYALKGIFESRIFTVGQDVAFNYFSFNTLLGASPLPLGTSISFNIAIKKADISGACNITSSDFVPFILPPSPISLPGTDYANPGQCFKYQAILNGDGSNTPILYDVTINYSL